MKKFNSLFILFAFSFSFLVLCCSCANYNKVVAKDLAGSIIRLHIRANSDSLEDQALKLKVRNAIVSHLEENMHETTVSGAYEYLRNNSDTLVRIARDEVADNGYSYDVTANLGVSTFPDRTYGGSFFPAGDYNSYIVNIGAGSGHNWWCVLYPPLCFIEDSSMSLPEDSREMLKDSLSSSEYEYVTKPMFRFKYFTFLNRFMD